MNVYTQSTFPFDWAMVQNNLASAYLRRIRGERRRKLGGGNRKYYRQALNVYTQSAFPFDWAMIQNNLAAAYLYRIK